MLLVSTVYLCIRLAVVKFLFYTLGNKHRMFSKFSKATYVRMTQARESISHISLIESSA